MEKLHLLRDDTLFTITIAHEVTTFATIATAIIIELIVTHYKVVYMYGQIVAPWFSLSQGPGLSRGLLLACL